MKNRDKILRAVINLLNEKGLINYSETILKDEWDNIAKDLFSYIKNLNKGVFEDEN